MQNKTNDVIKKINKRFHYVHIILLIYKLKAEQVSSAFIVKMLVISIIFTTYYLC